MEARKVIKIKNSLFINMPRSVVDGLKLEKGDVLWIGYLAGYGVVITTRKDAGNIPANVSGVDQIKDVVDEGLANIRRHGRVIERSMVNTIVTSLMGEGVKRELFVLQQWVGVAQMKIDELEKRVLKLSALVKDKKRG